MERGVQKKVDTEGGRAVGGRAGSGREEEGGREGGREGVKGRTDERRKGRG